MTRFHSFGRNVGVVGFIQLVLGLQELILLPLLTKNLSIESYGVWAQIVITIGMLPQIVLFGLPYTMVRYIPAIDNREDLQEIFYSLFSIVLLLTSIVSIIIHLLSEKIASMLFDNNLFVIHLLSSLIFFECISLFFISYLRAKQYINLYAKIMFYKIIATITIVGFFVYSGYGIQGAISGLFIVNMTVFIILSTIIYNNLGFKYPNFKNMKEYMMFGIPTIPGNLSSWVVNSSDRYVIGILLGTSSVGYYTPGYSLGSAMNILVAPLSFLLPSVLSESYDKKNIREVKLILSYSFKLYIVLAIPSVVGLSLLSKSFLTVFSTPEIAEKSYFVIPIVALSMLLFGANSIIVQILILEKNTMITGKIWILAALLNFGLNFLLIPHYGILGAAFTTLISFAISFILTFIYSYKKLAFDISLYLLLKSLFASFLMVLPIHFYQPTDLQSLSLTITLCAIIYLVSLYFLRIFKDNDIKLIKSIIYKTDT